VWAATQRRACVRRDKRHWEFLREQRQSEHPVDESPGPISTRVAAHSGIVLWIVAMHACCDGHGENPRLPRPRTPAEVRRGLPNARGRCGGTDEKP
jgi:hypothetical protein